MEISKGLQQEIQLVQNKLKNAIRDHQMCVAKLKDDPNNADILARIQEIQVHIVTLGRCQVRHKRNRTVFSGSDNEKKGKKSKSAAPQVHQCTALVHIGCADSSKVGHAPHRDQKQVVQRLRKEVEAFKAENANEAKVSFASLLGLNNNNHITANNEATTDEISEVKVVVTNGLDNSRLAAAKEDYEPVVRNGNVTRPPRGNVRKKERSISVETISAEEEIMEVVEVDDNEWTESPPNERKVNSKAQLNFLETLGLITTPKFIELQNKRAERKRRSTANPQFVYSNWEMPTKRKRHNYLQSANVPQTRQTTARLNGPSPPPTTNKHTATVPRPKSTTPPTRTIAKSLIPTQKTNARPNILRNMAESRVFVNKGRIENGNGQVQLSSGTKTPQTTTNSKTVHIPGLPLGLTIERIENDSAVCINCRNPGTLTNCDNCEANYHVSCHSISPPPPRLCPKCALRLKDASGTTTIKKNDELVAASYAPGVAGKAGEDPEVNKTSCGLYKVGAAAKQQQPIISGGRGGVNQLPASTFLIPISSNALASAANFGQSDNGVIADSSALEILKSSSNSDATAVANSVDQVSYNSSLVIGNQMSRSSITYVPQSQQHVSYAYQLPIGTTETSQSYFIVKKIAEPGKSNDGQEGKSLPTTSGYNSTRGGETGSGKSEKPIPSAALHLNKLTGRLAESIARGWKKSTTRAIPGLNRIAPVDGKSLTVTAEHADNDDVDKLSDGAYNGGNATSQQSRGNKLRNAGRGATETSRASRELPETADKRVELEITATKQTEQGFLPRNKSRSKSHSSLLNAMFPGHNQPNNLANRSDESQQRSTPAGNDGNNGNCTITRSDESYKPEQSVGDKPNCSELSASTEHVKLEEAHLSAPLRAKLGCDDDANILSNRQPINRLQNAARNLSNRRRTTEDRVSTPPLIRAFDASEQKRNRPRILMRSERKSLESGDLVFNESSADSEKQSRDFVIFERRYGRIPSDAKGTATTSSDTDSAEEVSSPDGSTSDHSPIKILDAAGEDDENERKDLNSEERETETNEDDVDDSADEVDDEEDDEEIEDEEEEEDQEDCPILDDDINERVNERLGINTVSTESMQVLEQFESAMLQVDSGDSTAKP